MAAVTLFIYFVFFSHLYTFVITYSTFIHPSPFAEAFIHFLHCLSLRGKNLPGCRSSRDLNLGLPYSRPAHYQVATLHPINPALTEISFSKTFTVRKTEKNFFKTLRDPPSLIPRPFWCPRNTEQTPPTVLF